MDPPPTPFSARISRTLSLALSAIIATNLVIGAISLVLAFQIYRINYSIDQENADILIVDQIHDAFDDIIFELHQMNATESFERMGTVLAMHRNLAERLDTFRSFHQERNNAIDGPDELTLLSDFDGLATGLRALSDRMAVAGPSPRLDRSELERLRFISTTLPRKAFEYSNAHRLRIARLMQSSQGMIQTKIGLYGAFLLIGVGIIAPASLALRRGITAPLRALADASRALSEGRLEERVPVRASNEIGQLSLAFNTMADRLQARERDLQSALDNVEQKVRETQALYRIGTEISRLHRLERILQTVVEKARELLRTEAAFLCLLDSDKDSLVVRARSGLPEAHQPTGHPAVCRGVPAAPGTFDRLCPGMIPESLQAHFSAPLYRGETIIGDICVCGRAPREFTTADHELLAGLATQASIAIENARLYEEVRGLATLEERERIAREMHDGLAQALGLLHLKLEEARERAEEADTADSTRDLQDMIAITDHAYEEVRQSIFGLRIMVSRGLGLIPTLTEYLHEFSIQNGIAVELETPDDRPFRLPPASEVQLIRIVQEALTNVRRHAGTDRAWVRLEREGPWVRVAIEDRGRGFDPGTPASSGRPHYGLRGMQERAEGLGGKLEVDTAPGRGTRIVATVPGEG